MSRRSILTVWIEVSVLISVLATVLAVMWHDYTFVPEPNMYWDPCRDLWYMILLMPLGWLINSLLPWGWANIGGCIWAMMSA